MQVDEGYARYIVDRAVTWNQLVEAEINQTKGLLLHATRGEMIDVIYSYQNAGAIHVQANSTVWDNGALELVLSEFAKRWNNSTNWSKMNSTSETLKPAGRVGVFFEAIPDDDDRPSNILQFVRGYEHCYELSNRSIASFAYPLDSIHDSSVLHNQVSSLYDEILEIHGEYELQKHRGARAKKAKTQKDISWKEILKKYERMEDNKNSNAL